MAGAAVEGLNPPMVLPCRNQAKLRGFALRFKCPDQSRAPGRKSQFSLEPERTFSANFWEVEQAGFRKLPSKGAEEVALALSLSSQTRNYYWPWALSHHCNPHPALWRLAPSCSCPALHRRMVWSRSCHALVSPWWQPCPNLPKSQTPRACRHSSVQTGLHGPWDGCWPHSQHLME